MSEVKNSAEVCVVNVIDAEGPLYESIGAKFDRINDLFSINHLERTKENFLKLQNGEIDLGGVEKKIQKVLSKHLVNYNDTWDKIDTMLEELMTEKFRMSIPDSYGNGWKFTWHCLDHVNYDYNPRRRDIGFHKVYDHYLEWLKRYPDLGDELEWHYHPMSVYKDAHRCATFYFSSDLVYQILARKIIERNWFPSCYKAGFEAERPDSNWFIEQWFPFDITNMAVDDPKHFDSTIDFKNGRSGNWRNAPSDWSIYNPSHDNYQVPGNCRRFIGRALKVKNRLASIDLRETEKAFSKAAKEQKPVLLGVTGHDFRNLATEADFVRSLLLEANKKYPEVKFRYCSVKEGFNRAIWGKNNNEEALELEAEFFPKTSKDVPNIIIKCVKGKVFGPQPFLAIKTKSRRFIYDNLDFIDENTWGYAFHGDTLPLDDVGKLSIAANDIYGNTCIKHII